MKLCWGVPIYIVYGEFQASYTAFLKPCVKDLKMWIIMGRVIILTSFTLNRQKLASANVNIRDWSFNSERI